MGLLNSRFLVFHVLLFNMLSVLFVRIIDLVTLFILYGSNLATFDN